MPDPESLFGHEQVQWRLDPIRETQGREIERIDHPSEATDATTIPTVDLRQYRLKCQLWQMNSQRIQDAGDHRATPSAGHRFVRLTRVTILGGMAQRPFAFIVRAVGFRMNGVRVQ